MKRIAIVLAVGAVGCGLPPKEQALVDVKNAIQADLTSLATEAKSLCDAAPAPKATGWQATDDKTAIDAMKAAWKRQRLPYERVEGAIAVLFPELDASFDERYDGFLESQGDTNLFDDQVVTGNHAIERILFSDSTPAAVKTFEQGLGAKYVAARWPQNQQEATEFKEKLCARFVKDAEKMRDDFKPLALDTASAFRGVIGSLAEQVEKADLAATGEEESRYSQFTLADMRANLAGGKKTYELFSAWVLTTKDGKALDGRVRAGFSRLEGAYAAVSGDALPEVPATWSSQNPSAADLMTPFGKLYAVVKAEADDTSTTSLVTDMNLAADALGIPQLPNQ